MRNEGEKPRPHITYTVFKFAWLIMRIFFLLLLLLFHSPGRTRPIIICFVAMESDAVTHTLPSILFFKRIQGQITDVFRTDDFAVCGRLRSRYFLLFILNCSELFVESIVYCTTHTALCVCNARGPLVKNVSTSSFWLTYWDRAVNYKSINIFSIYSLLIYIWNVLSVRRIRRGFCSTEIFCSCQLKNNFNPLTTN
jgi:hypothetical protein